MSKTELVKAAEKLVLGNKAADIDTCLDSGEDFDALTSLSSQISVRYHKTLARKPMNAELEAALKQRVAFAGKVTDDSDENDMGDLTNTDKKHETCAAIADRFQVSGYKVARAISEMLFNTKKSFIEMMDDDYQDSVDPDLYAEMLVCMGSDPYNSQPCNQMQESIGIEFEEYLVERLREKNLCFETEADSRLRGKSKTPDVLFTIPVALPACEATNNLPTIVNWIDSKAMYADEETLREHIEQLRWYINRYGRGIVIYWRGYTDTIKESPLYKSTNGMIVILDDVPQDWILPVKETA